MVKQEDVSLVAKQLARFEPGFLPKAVFEAVARLVVTPTFVLIPLFKRGNKTRVYLTRRDANDSHYAGLLHPPGKIMLASDKSLDAIFKRLITSELTEIEGISTPRFVESFYDQIARGREISMVHFSTIRDPGDGVASFDCAALPDDIILTDIQRIQCAVQAFEQDYKS